MTEAGAILMLVVVLGILVGAVSVLHSLLTIRFRK